MKLAAKDLNNMKATRMSKMHDYKGFTVEPIPGGYNILLYGRKHILYVSGPAGMSLTEDMKKARAFRDANFCHGVINEFLEDHATWVQSLGGMKVTNLNEIREVIDKEKQIQSSLKKPFKLLPELAESLIG
jgi:hypothetical protein